MFKFLVTAEFAKELDPATAVKVILIFIGTYAGVCLLLSYIGGWMTLATSYRSSREVRNALTNHFQSASMRLIGFYNHCLSITPTKDGLFISVFFLFRIGHPPLFVPWDDITMMQARWLFGDMVELRFSKAPTIPFRISKSLYEDLLVEAG